LYFQTNGRRIVAIDQPRKKVRTYLKIAPKPKRLEVWLKW
jgi:hypothetical protein